MIYLLASILILLTAAMLWLPALAWLGMGTLPAEWRSRAAGLKWFTLMATGFWLVTAILTGARLDYSAYLMQWQMVVDAQSSPWGEHSTNAYGPLYNLLALPYLIDPFLPKLLFVFAWTWASMFLVGQALRHDDRPGLHAWLIAVFMLAGPFLAIQIAYYGFFDILPAGLCLLAVHLRLRKRDGLSGAALAGAVLLKYYPLALLPFLMLDRRRGLRVRLGASCVGLIGVVMLASWLVWGESTLHPLNFAGERPSKWLSIFRFLRGPYSPLTLWMENPNADHLSLPAMVVFGGGAWLVCWWRRVPCVTACVIGVVIALQFYKVGHVQFQMLPVLLILYWLATGGLLSREYRPALIAVLGYLIWLCVFVVVFAVLRRVSREGLLMSSRDFAGLIAFTMTVWLVVAVYKAPKPPNRPEPTDTTQSTGPVV